MGNEHILSSVAFFLGLVGVVIALLPFIDMGMWGLYNSIIPILLGIIGFILSSHIKKKLSDDIVKAGLVVNPIAVIIGIVQFFI